MATLATKFREYLLGREPADWTHLYTAERDWLVRSVTGDPTRGCWLVGGGSGTPEVLSWDAAGSSADQEVLALVMLNSTGDNSGLIALRTQAPAVSWYQLAVLPSSGRLRIEKMTAGTVSLLAAQVGFSWSAMKPFWVRFRAEGTTLSAKSWLDGETEPGSWQVTTTASFYAAGRLGFARSVTSGLNELLFFSVGLDGATAPGPESIPGGIAEWSQDPTPQVEFVAEIETFDPLSEVGETIWLSTRGRTTGPLDYPPNVEMPPFLLDPGALEFRLQEDLLYGGGADLSLGSALFRNILGELDFLFNRTLAGRRITVRAGLADFEQHRPFEPLYTGLFEGEPSIGDQIEAPLQAPLRQFEKLIKSRRHVGIPTGLVLNGEGHAAPSSVTYDTTRWLVSFRFKASSAPEAFGVRRLAGALDQFDLWIEAGTGYVVAGSTPMGVLFRHQVNLLDGNDHQVAYSVAENTLAYLMVDGEVVAQLEPALAPDIATGGSIVLFGWRGQLLYDLRLLNYQPDPAEAQSALGQRDDGDDPGVVGLWRCDDSIGAVATDYSPVANHLSLSGTVNVNYTWTATDQGSEEQAGEMMVISAGAIFNGSALLIDRNRQRFRLSDDFLPLDLVVRSKGIVVGTWTDEGGGVISFPTVTSEPLTFDYPSGENYRAATIAEQLVVNRLELTEAQFDPESFRALNPLFPCHIGYQFGDETSGNEALQAVLGPIGAHYRVDRDGRLVAGAILPPISPSPGGKPALEFLGTRGRSRAVWSSTSGDLPNGPFTICFWALTFAVDRYFGAGDVADPFPSFGAIANNHDGGTGGYYIGLSRVVDGAVGIFVPWLSSQYFITPRSIIPLGRWTFVVIRYDGSFLEFHVATASRRRLSMALKTATSGTKVNSGVGLEIGGRVGNTSGDHGSLAGSVAHYQVYASALSDKNISDLLDADGVPSDKVSPSFYAPLTEGQGEFAADQVSGSKGRIFGCRWAPRFTIDFRSGHSSSAFRFKRLRPAYDISCPWGQNYRPLSDSDLAGTVTATDAARLKRKTRAHHLRDGKVKDKYRDSREVLGQTSSLAWRRDAGLIARNYKFRLDPARIQALLGDASRPSLSLGVGDEIHVYHPRLPGSQGAVLRVVGVAPSLNALVAQIDLWGEPLPYSEATILATDLGAVLVDSGDPLITE